MVNINVAKNTPRYKFLEEMLGAPHMTVFKDGKSIAVWYMDEADKKALDEMEKETVKE